MDRVAQAFQTIAPQWMLGQQQPTPAERTLKVLKTAAIVFACGFATSAAVYGVGVGIGMLGAGLAAKQLIHSPEALLELGKHVSWVGEKIFQVFGVPLYGVLYELPRWIYNTGLPFAVTCIRETTYEVGRLALLALSTVSHAVMQAAEATYQAIKWVADDILYPLAQRFFSACQSVAEQAAEALFKYVLSPLGHAIGTLAQHAWSAICSTATWTWDNVAVPLAQTIAKVAQAIYEPLIKGLSYVFNEVIVPAAQYLGHLAGRGIELLTEGIVSAVSSLANGVMYVIREVVIPAWDKFAAVAAEIMISGWNIACSITRWVGDKIISPVLHALVNAVCHVWNLASRGFTYVGNVIHQAIRMACNSIASAATYLARHTWTALTWAADRIVPVLARLAQAISHLWNLSRTAFWYLANNWVVPAAKVLFNVTSLVARTVLGAAVFAYNGVANLAIYTWGVISAGCNLALTKVVNPALQALATLVTALWETARASVQYIGREWMTPAGNALWQAKEAARESLYALAANTQAALRDLIAKIAF